MPNIAEMAKAEPMRQATLKYSHLGGLFMRSALLSMFRDIEIAGGTVSYRNEYRSFGTTTFTQVRIEGPAWLLLSVHKHLVKLSGE